MMAWYTTLCQMMLWLMLKSPITEADPEQSILNDARYQAGMKQYDMIKQMSSKPRYSQCWTAALDSLDHGCKHLTEDVQHKMALQFTNCFLLKTGREIYACRDSDPIDVCTRDMKPEAYNTFTEFFTHTQNICFFLQAQTWQEETEQTIERLSDNSAKVAKQMEDSTLLQAELIDKQNQSLENQDLLLTTGNELKKTLEDSAVDVQSMMKEFKDATTEHRALIFEVFDRVNSLRSIVLGEVTGFYTLIFYLLSLVVCYVLTSTPRTSGARFWLFVILSANVVLERLVVMYTSKEYEDTESGSSIEENNQIYRRLWLCRKFFLSLAVIVWVKCAFCFCDYNRENNQLLVEIRKQNSDLKHLLQTDTPVKKENLEKTFRNQSLHLYSDRVKNWVSQTNATSAPFNKSPDKESTGYETGTESDGDTVSLSSLNSMLTDRTFTVTEGKTDMSMETDSWCTETATNMSSLCAEVEDIRDSTPLRELEISTSSLNETGESIISSSKKRGRPKGSKNKSHLISPIPIAVNDGRYNLRSTRGVSKTVNNSVTSSESAQDFGRTVKHLAQIAKRNRAKVDVTIGRKQLQLSSDEC